MDPILQLDAARAALERLHAVSEERKETGKRASFRFGRPSDPIQRLKWMNSSVEHGAPEIFLAFRAVQDSLQGSSCKSEISIIKKKKIMITDWSGQGLLL